jgi:hypothetical protein
MGEKGVAVRRLAEFFLHHGACLAEIHLTGESFP